MTDKPDGVKITYENEQDKPDKQNSAKDLSGKAHPKKKTIQYKKA